MRSHTLSRPSSRHYNPPCDALVVSHNSFYCRCTGKGIHKAQMQREENSEGADAFNQFNRCTTSSAAPYDQQCDCCQESISRNHAATKQHCQDSSLFSNVVHRPSSPTSSFAFLPQARRAQHHAIRAPSTHKKIGTKKKKGDKMWLFGAITHL